jgi:hypothetical protein
MDLIYLCDLTHTAQGVNAELVPYPVGCIKSYFHAYSSRPAEIELFKYPHALDAAFRSRRPAIVGFSNYMWNLDLSYTIAAAIKRHAPETLIVFGGPNYPLESERQEAWLRNHPAVDIYLVGEGERPFAEVAQTWLETRSIDAAKRAGVNGVHTLIDGRLVKYNGVRRDGFDDSPRITELDATPSPYLEGYLDKFLGDASLVPLMESNRGCPFTCAFCVDGIGARSKVNKASVERLRDELTYIAERYTGKYLTLADTNFGMFKEDVEFCRVIAEIKRKFDYPHHLQVSTGKNQQARIIACADLLEGSLRFSASVQSLDDEVLKNIKRSNISYEQIIAVSSRLSPTDANTYSEVILALPGDSRAKHVDTVCRLIDADFNQIRLFTLMVLDGSELATRRERDRFAMQTRYRVVPRSFGFYEFAGETLSCVEIEEVCVENASLPFEDYLECRAFALTVTLFYNDNIFLELTRLIRRLGLKVSDWLLYLHGRREAFPAALRAMYAGFLEATSGELAPTHEALADDIKGSAAVLESYLAGERGNNVLFNTQAQVYLTCMEALHDVAFDELTAFLARNAAAIDLPETYLADLKRYSLAKKRSFIDLTSEAVADFDFDFVALEKDGFEELPAGMAPTRIRFFHQPWQQRFFQDQLDRHGRSLQALGKVLSRIPIKKTHRTVEYAGSSAAPASRRAGSASAPELFGPAIV